MLSHHCTVTTPAKKDVSTYKLHIERILWSSSCNTIICLMILCRFLFPTVLILYQTVAILIVSALDLLRYNSTDDLLCSSKDLTESLKAENSTPLCEFLGTSIHFVHTSDTVVCVACSYIIITF